jgi:hypothetical protein
MVMVAVLASVLVVPLAPHIVSLVRGTQSRLTVIVLWLAPCLLLGAINQGTAAVAWLACYYPAYYIWRWILTRLGLGE